uniref:group II intron reverse transcriptase/maturase mat1 n=1 Tax=Flexiglena variabilis TaxID=2743688 RepID=UPI0023AA5B19|nr:group II intron reverse transcriptase/maturase mat1 [Flexiglena variabilis]WCH63520.1 group II intron reverse transcriptase/maturase mat1 [Flexiglena variabilis]
MLNIKEEFSHNWNTLSWEKCQKNVSRIQLRIFKSVKVGDVKKAIELQKLLLKSSSSRLLAIRYATQLSLKKKISGIDGKISLNFNERFNLDKYLLINMDNWNPQKLKIVFRSVGEGVSDLIKVPTISDRAWYCLVSIALEPAHEAIFSSRSFKFGSLFFLHQLQEILVLNLNSFSFGVQKRVLIVEFDKCFDNFNIDKLLRMIIAPRSIKIGIFRLLQLGFLPSFNNVLDDVDTFASLLANIFLSGVETLHNGVRYGLFSYLLFFLKPEDDENFLIRKLNSFLITLSLTSCILKVHLHSAYNGFNFLNWHFKIFSDGKLKCVPTSESYTFLLKRIKFIINNSNYGAKVKVAKLSPIIREWKNYYKFCNLEDSRFSLFLIQKKAFKVFNKESKQDIYSVQKLLSKSLFSFKVFDPDLIDSLYYGHLIFNSKYFFTKSKRRVSRFTFSFCIYCGISGFHLVNLNK